MKMKGQHKSRWEEKQGEREREEKCQKKREAEEKRESLTNIIRTNTRTIERAKRHYTRGKEERERERNDPGMRMS